MLYHLLLVIITAETNMMTAIHITAKDEVLGLDVVTDIAAMQ